MSLDPAAGCQSAWRLIMQNPPALPLSRDFTGFRWSRGAIANRPQVNNLPHKL